MLSGCVTLKDPEASLEYTGDVVARLSADQRMAQTFVSRRPGMNGVQLWLRQVEAPTQPETMITARLHRVEPNGELSDTGAVASLRAAALGRAFPATFSFPSQDDPSDQKYQVSLTLDSGAYEILGRAEDAYPQGELWVDGIPQPTDAAFRLTYDYDVSAVLADLGKAARGLWLVIPLLLVLWVPGRLLLAAIEDRLRLDWGERTAMAAGLSLAVAPVVLLWTTTIGLHWSRAGIIAAYLLTAAGLAAVLYRRRQSRVRRSPFRVDPTAVALLAIFLFTLALRLIMVRDLAGPAWVDSVHHSLITRLIMDQGALPDTYAPFAEVAPADYHSGYHTVTAAFTAISGLELTRSMLLFGQVLNALSVFFVYLFTVTLTRRPLAGLIAALMAGVFSPMPAYYVSWGRYTQLAGTVVLPVCLRLLLEVIRPGQVSRRMLLIAGLACAGLFLIHYRVIIFFAVLLLAYGLAELIRLLDKQPVWRSASRMAGRGALVGGAAVLLSLPWFVMAVQAELAPRLAGTPLPAQPLDSIAWGFLTPAFGKPLLVLALVGLVVAILRTRWFAPILALWTGLLFMTAGRGVISLPTAGGVNTTSVEILLFLPITALAGWLVAELLTAAWQVFPRSLRLPYAALVTGAAAWLSVLGAQALLPILNPITLLFREADHAGIAWAAANIPAEETVLVNPFLWGYGFYAGQDGGAFLPALAGRQTVPPPVLYAEGAPDYIERMKDISRVTLENGKDAQALHNRMAAEGIRYVYLGARGGAISPKALRDSPLFELLYSQNGVYIFMLR